MEESLVRGPLDGQRHDVIEGAQRRHRLVHPCQQARDLAERRQRAAGKDHRGDECAAGNAAVLNQIGAVDDYRDG
ncbi:hypothetical protein D3C83_196590 [compost metagenome]